MGKIYRTAQGRELDMEAIKLKNEMVPALGNMNVNARGDQLGPGGRIIKTREQIMNDHYRARGNQNTVKHNDDPIPTRSMRRADDPIVTSSKKAREFNPGGIAADAPKSATTETTSEQAEAEQQTGLKGGLARAVKRAQDGAEKKGLRRI